jgi:immune inhibitor A
VRPDLTGPDGRPGIDLRGYTVKNHYQEMSKGAYDITGEIAGWVQVPHSEAYYGAARCGEAPQDNAGHPDNARQVGQLVVDVVDALAASNPDFPGPTTTSRTRATPTATATCSRPTGSSTTS